MNTPETPTPMTDAMHKWSALLIGENCGLLGPERDAWETHPAHYERTKLVRLKDAVELERENAQLRKELSERLVNYCVCTGTQSPVADCVCVSCTTKRIEAERDHFRTLAQTNWKMAEDLAKSLEQLRAAVKEVLLPALNKKGPTQFWLPEQMQFGSAVTNTDETLSRFQTLKQQQPK